jgi:hypothetical protein
MGRDTYTRGLACSDIVGETRDVAWVTGKDGCFDLIHC